MSNSSGASFVLDVKHTVSPWECYLLKATGFPLDSHELHNASHLVHAVADQIIDKLKLHSEVFIQVEQSDDKEYRNLHAEHAREWIPEVGLGVWPDREPPAPWTQEEFMDSAATGKLRPLFYQVLRVTTSPEARRQARTRMLRFGPLLEIATADNSDTFLETARKVLLPPITDLSFKCFPYYVPLFEVKSFMSATPEQLAHWFCGAVLYIRESFEDQGILFASREPLGPILTELGGRFEEHPDPAWRIPAHSSFVRAQ